VRTYGKVSYREDRKAWQLILEPHIALRLKRVFAKVDKFSHGHHLISDTPENCRDLIWFMERYPLEVADRAKLEVQANIHMERTALVDDLLSRRVPSQPFEMAIPPREYQSLAANLLLASHGLLLADDVGLGKTASAICTFSDPATLPALVVTLTHLPIQWQAEIEKFAPGLRTHIIKKGTPYDLTSNRRKTRNLFLPDSFPDVVIINYHKLSGWAETLAPIVKSVVFDEVQELRHMKSGKKTSAKYAAAEHISSKAQFRMGLSATPFYNFGGEMFNVMNCTCPGALGSHEEFVREWCKHDYQENKLAIKDPKAFGAYLRETGMMLRRTRADVGRELPALTKIPHHIDCDIEALDKVSLSCAELAKIILAQGESYRGQKMESSGQLDNIIRQATGIAKAPYVAEFCRLLVESGEQVVLFGWHRAVYDIWLDRLKDLNFVMYTGSESAAQKEQAKQDFMSKKAKGMIISLRAGAGMDGLQKVCRTTVHGELDWSPGVMEQNIGRIYRDGQSEPVVSYFLLSTEGSDPLMTEALGLKKAQIEGVRDDKQELLEKLQNTEGYIKRLAESYLAKMPQERHEVLV